MPLPVMVTSEAAGDVRVLLALTSASAGVADLSLSKTWLVVGYETPFWLCHEQRPDGSPGVMPRAKVGERRETERGRRYN